MTRKHLLIVVLCSGSIFANQNDDVVYLKNGARIQGVIIETIPKRRIKIETINGRVSTYKFSEIERITTSAAEAGGETAVTTVEVSKGSLTVENLNPVQKRKVENFKKHGGWLVGIDAGANGVFLSSSGKASGGGGASLGIPFYYLSPANSKTDTFSTFGFAAGIGSSMEILKIAGNKNLQMQIESFVKIGGFFGLSSTPLSIGIFYKPTYSLLLNLGNIEYNRVSNFNPAGFEVEFLFASVNENLARFIKSPIFKFSIFVLPTKDAFFATLNIAVVNYW